MSTKEKTGNGELEANKSSSPAKSKNKKCIHDGHRERLIETAVNAGLANMSKFQIVETFLTYILPRGDVNPLAHRVLDRFENFNHAVDAELEDLKQVKGINVRAARKIKLFKEFFYYYNECRMAKKCKVENLGDLINIAEDYLRFRNTEHLLLIAISPAGIVTHKRLINMNRQDEVGMPVLEFAAFLSSSKPASVAVAHCHPYGSANPSEEDEEAFQKLDDLCNSFGVNFIESFIVGEEGVFGQRENILLRHYEDVSKVKNSFQIYSNK